MGTITASGDAVATLGCTIALMGAPDGLGERSENRYDSLRGCPIAAFGCRMLNRGRLCNSSVGLYDSICGSGLSKGSHRLYSSSFGLYNSSFCRGSPIAALGCPIAV